MALFQRDLSDLQQRRRFSAVFDLKFSKVALLLLFIIIINAEF